jgi:hypothetical protein
LNCELRISKRSLVLLCHDVLSLLGRCWDIMLKQAKTVSSLNSIIHRSSVNAYLIWYCIVSAGKRVSSFNLRTELADKTERWKSLSPKYFTILLLLILLLFNGLNLSTFYPLLGLGKYIYIYITNLLFAWYHCCGNFNNLHTRAFSNLLPHHLKM